MEFSKEELMVIKYALNWMDNPYTFEEDFTNHKDIWRASFGDVNLGTILSTHTMLLNKLTNI